MSSTYSIRGVAGSYVIFGGEPLIEGALCEPLPACAAKWHPFIALNWLTLGLGSSHIVGQVVVNLAYRLVSRDNASSTLGNW